MANPIRENLERLDLSDVRLLAVGLVLLLIPVFWFFFLSGVREEQVTGTRLSFADPGKQSAFNLTASGKSPAARSARSAASAINPPVEKIEVELDRAWSKIQSVPKVLNLPPDVPSETRLMIQAEDDEQLCEANAMLDQCDFAAAEKAFAAALGSTGGNDFKELYAWGGLMEVYQLSGNQAKFREAFANYVKAAQKLHHVYGPLADNVARAYEMFDQLSRVDSGKLREYLTRANLANGSNVSYEEFMKAINHTKEWFPANLESPEPRMPDLLQPNSDG
jgi:hypothetical protein